MHGGWPRARPGAPRGRADRHRTRFSQIRTAIDLAPSQGITAWEALGQLGVRYGIAELVSLRSSIELAQDDGARVKASLIARAETMRSARLAAAWSAPTRPPSR